MNKLFATDPTARDLLAMRLVLGAVMFPHGAQKMLGWFGGGGFSATMGYLTGGAHIPAPLAFLVICGEFFGSLGLLFGAFTRVAAFGVISIMLGAVAMVHLPNGFFMNWMGSQKGEGFEYHLLAVGLAGVLLARGAGAFSIDAWLAERLGSSRRRRELTAQPAE